MSLIVKPAMEVVLAEPKVFGVDEAAELLNTSKWKIYKLVEDGKITYVPVGSTIQFTIKDIDDYIESQRTRRPVKKKIKTPAA